MQKNLRNLVPMNSVMFSGVKIRYGNNVLYSCSKRTAAENFELAQTALCTILGTDAYVMFGVEEESNRSFFEENGGTVEFYRSIG